MELEDWLNIGLGLLGLLVLLAVVLGILAIVALFFEGLRYMFQKLWPILTVIGIVLLLIAVVVGSVSTYLEKRTPRVPFAFVTRFFDTETSDERLKTPTPEKTLEERIESYVAEYGERFVASVNARDFSLVQDELYPDSPLYRSQEALVERLSRRNITERIVTFDVYDVAVESEEWAFAKTYEAIDVYGPDGVKETALYWTYHLKWNDARQRYELYAIEETKR